jgi:hypothetical protein
VEVELSRYDWGGLRSFAGDSTMLAPELRKLAVATTREYAELAFRRIEGATLDLGRLSESSTAVASCLVHALWKCSDEAEGYILELLSLIAGAEDDFPENESLGQVSHTECMRSVELGFPVYCEVLERSVDESRIVAAIDLVSLCGVSNISLRPAARYALEMAKTRDPSSKHTELIENSISELD